MPVELVLEMHATKTFSLPVFTGYVSRGVFLNMLRWVNPNLSEEYHKPNMMKPYSVTPLYFKREKTGEKDKHTVNPDYPCIVKIRLLRDEDSNHILNYFREKNTITVYGETLHVSSINVQTKSYEELEKESKPLEKLYIYFKTPTYLTSLGSEYHELFPNPVKVFPNLMRLWDQYTTTKKFGKEKLEEYKEWLTKNIGVAEYKLETRLVYMGKKKAKGFVGWVTYETKTMDKWSKTTSMLAKYAEYSNIGGNRTGGFGVVKTKP
ncbi:MAG: CRISPR-associated endoribonuclease Cas6 [Candidatus Bathyarchaeota archaeon]|nr:CRISPR-associated endoribonuclease Cas6 [Candidatus Bathyarchaeota archaeon]